jgi:hypothetical protein
VTLALREFEGASAQLVEIVTGLQAEDAEDGTHGGLLGLGFEGFQGPKRRSPRLRRGLRERLSGLSNAH